MSKEKTNIIQFPENSRDVIDDDITVHEVYDSIIDTTIQAVESDELFDELTSILTYALTVLTFKTGKSIAENLILDETDYQSPDLEFPIKEYLSDAVGSINSVLLRSNSPYRLRTSHILYVLQELYDVYQTTSKLDDVYQFIEDDVEFFEQYGASFLAALFLINEHHQKDAYNLVENDLKDFEQEFLTHLYEYNTTEAQILAQLTAFQQED